MNKHWLGGFPQNRASNHLSKQVFHGFPPETSHTLGVYSSWVNNDHDLPTTRGFYGDLPTASITRGEGFARIRLDSSLVQLRLEMRPSTCQIQIPTGRGLYLALQNWERTQRRKTGTHEKSQRSHRCKAESLLLQAASCVLSVLQNGQNVCGTFSKVFTKTTFSLWRFSLFCTTFAVDIGWVLKTDTWWQVIISFKLLL